MGDEGEGVTPDVRRDLEENADRAKAEGRSPERKRAAIAVVVAQTPEPDGTGKLTA